MSDWSADVCSSDLDELLRLQRAQQAAEVAGVQGQALPQGAHVGAVGAGFEEQPGFGEGSPAPEVVVAQEADPTRSEAGRVGKAGVSQCGSRCAASITIQKTNRTSLALDHTTN